MDERSSAAYDYELPSELIAQAPAERRDASRLLVLCDGALQDRYFSDLPELVRPGDVLVLNETRVIAARLFGRRRGGGRVEILLLHPAGDLRYDPFAVVWCALVRPGSRVRVGARVEIVDAAGEALAVAEVLSVNGADGTRELRFESTIPMEALLARAGRLALPPYIHNESQEAQERYQTVFARVPGSVAAPTAALHVTPELLERLAERGVEVAKLTLDVGMGTFRPMKSERIDEHTMHAERYVLPQETVDAIDVARARGGRVVALGTTVVRALEGNVAAHGGLRAGEFQTSLFVTPGFHFRVVDALVTNFHLPRSTLLVLVSAFAGRERVLAAYRHAVECRYRFFSFGDAMLVCREASP